MGFMSPSVDDTAAAEEAQRQKRITEGTAKVNRAFAGFTPDFYSGQTRAYNEYALPQLEDQFKTAGEKLKYAMARQFGTTQTSEAAKRQGELAKRYALAKTQVTETGLQRAQKAQADVESERSRILGMLNTTADPAAAAQQAFAASKTTGQGDVLQPLQDLFGDVTGGLAAAYGPTGGLYGDKPTSYDSGYYFDPVSKQYKSKSVSYG